MKLNVASKKKVSKKDTVENIYLSNSASTSDRRKVSKNNITTQNANTTKSPDCKKSSMLKNDKVTTSVVVRKSNSNIKQSDALDKKQSKILAAKMAGKSKKGKNFILENKLNVKKMSSANKSQVCDSNLDSNDFLQNVRNNNSTIQY